MNFLVLSPLTNNVFQDFLPTDHFPQTSTFYNMEHERMFHIVLASIAIPFLVVAPATYVYEFTQHDGEFFRDLILFSFIESFESRDFFD